MALYLFNFPDLFGGMDMDGPFRAERQACLDPVPIDRPERMRRNAKAEVFRKTAAVVSDPRIQRLELIDAIAEPQLATCPARHKYRVPADG